MLEYQRETEEALDTWKQSDNGNGNGNTEINFKHWQLAHNAIEIPKWFLRSLGFPFPAIQALNICSALVRLFAIEKLFNLISTSTSSPVSLRLHLRLGLWLRLRLQLMSLVDLHIIQRGYVLRRISHRLSLSFANVSLTAYLVYLMRPITFQIVIFCGLSTTTSTALTAAVKRYKSYDEIVWALFGINQMSLEIVFIW